MAGNPLLKATTRWLSEAGFPDAEVVRDSYAPKHFGNGEVVFKIGRLYVRFLRDRSQDFVDLAASASPEAFHQFGDVEIAMGWKSVEEVLALDQPEEVPAVLKRLSERFQHLETAFSGIRGLLTKTRVEAAARERGAALIRRLQG